MNSSDNRIFALDIKSPVAGGARMFSRLNSLLERLLLLNRLNDVYAGIDRRAEAGDFAERALAALKIAYRVEEEDKAQIPAKGPLIVVANHPFGGVEGLMLASALLSVRPDVRIMANYLLGRIPEMRRLIIPVDPFGGGNAVRRNLKPLREALSWLRGDGALAVFPAGEVSHLHLRKHEVVDPAWSDMVARVIRKADAPVLPVFFHGRNSALFQVAGLLHPRLRTALLPHELLNKTSCEVRVEIGNRVPAEKVRSFEDDAQLTAYLRTRTYALRCRKPARKRGGKRMGPSGKNITSQERVVEGPTKEIIQEEVKLIPPGQVLCETERYSVMYAKAQQMPNLLYEIGRLREISFREAGEGTGRSVDLDRFDLYYVHLFLWDKDNSELAGAYRLAPVDRVIERFGIKGLYTSTLFTYKETFFRQMGSAVELGRSFVRAEYQKSYSTLFLLWKGIARYMAFNPQYSVLFGAVTISDMYSPASRQLIVSFLKWKNYAPRLARMVRPKASLRPERRRSAVPVLHPELIADVDELSACVSDLETDRKGVPVLLRQYLRMGGKLMGFSVDRSFSNGLDGLVMVDLTKCEPKVLERLMGREEAEVYLSHHLPPEERRAS